MYIPLSRSGAVNDIPARSVVGSASGPTLGQRAGANTPYTTADAMSGSGVSIDGTGAADGNASHSLVDGSLFGKPLTWWGVLVLVLFAIMYAAKRYGPSDEFRNLKLSVYNVGVVSGMSVVGIAFFKVLFNRFPVKGLTPLVNAV